MSETNPAGATPATTTPPPDPDLEGLGDKGKLTLIKVREERDAAQAAKDAADKELDILRKAEAKRAKAEQDAKEQKAKDDGEWERLATERDESLKSVTGERDDYKGRYEKALAAIKPGIEAAWNGLPPEIVAMYDGEADDVLAKAAFIERTKTLATALTGRTALPGNPFPATPRPNEPAAPVETEVTRLQRTGKYSI